MRSTCLHGNNNKNRGQNKKCPLNTVHRKDLFLNARPHRWVLQLNQMQNSSAPVAVPSDLSDLRNQRLLRIRANLKEMPLLTQTTSRIQKKISLNRTLTHHTDSSLEVDSLSGRGSEDDTLISDNSFLDKYELLQKLGEGGNGCVFQCRYKGNNNTYAVKKFLVEQEHILEIKRSFLIMRELKHPSICHYKALYLDNAKRVAYLVMEHFPFPSLADAAIGSEKELTTIVRQIVTALTYLNNRNICHRDLKPQNILYDKDNKRIKLIDFGISKKTFLRGQRRDMLTVIGSHFYMAPEVFLGGGYDERVDLWALGVIIYKLVTGSTPFQSEYHSETVNNIMKGETQYDDKIWSQYSFFAKDFVSRLLKKKDERMSLKQTENHLWIQLTHPRKEKLHRLNSHVICMSQAFKYEMRNNIRHANSKEEGEQLERSTALGRSINLISEKQYDLSDSDQEEVKVSRSVNLSSRPATLKIVPVLFQEESDQQEISI